MGDETPSRIEAEPSELVFSKTIVPLILEETELIERAAISFGVKFLRVFQKPIVILHFAASFPVDVRSETVQIREQRLSSDAISPELKPQQSLRLGRDRMCG